MKKGLRKPIALLLSAMMIFSTSASAFPAMAEDNLIFEKAENNSIHSDYEFHNFESEITVTTCENEENPLEIETTTVSTTTEVSVQYSEEQTESNPVEVHNGDYAVYSDSNIPEGDGSESNPYQISNSSQLFWFADQVNNERKTSISAVLTTDIVVNDNLLDSLKFDEKGDVTNEEDLEIWTPIGNNSRLYEGTFDGQNHTISGLYFNNKNTYYVGLFGFNDSGTIKNVGIIDSYFKGKDYVGGLCGYNRSSNTIEDSYNTGTVIGSGSCVGGICGFNDSSSIKNSYNTGSVSGSSDVGGICGLNGSGSIEKSYNTGSVSGSGSYVGGICGYNSTKGTIENSFNTGSVIGSSVSSSVGGVCGVNYNTIKNSYNTGSVNGSIGVGGVCGMSYNDTMKNSVENSYNTGSVSGSEKVGGVCGANNSSVKNSYNTGSVSGSKEVGSVCGRNIGTIENTYYLENCNAKGTTFDCNGGTAQTSEQFESGEVAYLLQKGQETEIWGQEIGKDKLPVLNSKKVYQNITCSGCCEKYQGDITYVYSNTEANPVYSEHQYENGICTGCGTYEPIEPELKDGYYQIENVNHLYWFEKQVNNSNTNINAILTADIVVNTNVLNADGTLNSGSVLTEWTPIGNNYIYTGTFDGNNHTISGLYFNNENIDYVGLFGSNSGTIKNVGIIDSYFKGRQWVGGVCGHNLTKGTIANSYNTGSVSGAQGVGGVCGINYKGTIANSYNTGSVSGTSDVGGVCGNNYYGGTIKNSYNIGSVSGSGSYVGGVCGYNYSNSTIENSHNTGSVSGSGNYVGGVCGHNLNNSTIENSHNTGSVSGSTLVGGVCGYNYSNSTIENSHNTGSVSGSGNGVGGVCGTNGGTVENTYNTGSVSGSTNVGGVCGYNWNGTITNSYYNKSVYSGGAVGYNNNGTVNKVSGKTSEQFESGEVAYLLGEMWGQEIGKDKLPVLNSENKVYKVTIYSILENETSSETSSSESYVNAFGTLTAPIKEGYNFKGWYTYDESNDNHYTGNVICSSREYNNSNVTADSKIVAVYTSLGTASITINCDREYTVNGVSKSSATTESYPIGSTVKLSCSDENFAYWQNNAGTILSRENEYSFVVTNAEIISAVFNEIVDNKVTLIFESFYGQVIATKQLGSDEIIDTDTISVPVRTGYNALGWDFDGDGKYDKNKDTLESAITRGFESDSRTVRIVQVYELISETYNITVENGSGSGTYNQNDIVTAIADEARVCSHKTIAI